MENNISHTQHLLNGLDISRIDKHPNILIAASFWDEERYHAARVCYRFMREIDDLVDSKRSGDQKLSCLEKRLLSKKVDQWIACLGQHGGNDLPAQELVAVLEKFRIPLGYFNNFARAMQYDIDHNGFLTFDAFLEYAEGASVAPASIFLHLCCLEKKNGSYALPDVDILELARPCAIFSYLVHIIRDFREDQKENLNYFASDVLQTYRLSPANLREIAVGAEIPDEFREVVRFYKQKADIYRKQTINKINYLRNKVDGRYMLSLEVIYRLYLAIFNRIDPDGGTYTREELIPSNDEVIRMVEELG